MSNMAYCRFHNTRQDLIDCYDNWDEVDPESEEGKERALLLKLCQKIVRDYEEDE